METPSNNGQTEHVSMEIPSNNGQTEHVTMEIPSNNGETEQVSMETPSNNGETEHVSVEIPSIELANSITAKLSREIPASYEKCIWRVPERLRCCNKKAYDPKIISIGPYHHGKEELDPMEKIKSWYLQSLLDRLPGSPEQTLAVIVQDIRGLQSCAEGCYADKYESELVGDKFVEMLILDGCFLVELFRKDSWWIRPHDADPIFCNFNGENDPRLSTQLILPDLYYDLLLLENQIPWVVLLRLFQLTEPALKRAPQEMDNDVLAMLVLKFFERMMLLTEPVEYKNGYEIKHVLNLLHNCLVSSFATKTLQDPTPWKLVPPVTDLLAYGVKFKKGSPSNILNIKFSEGVFEIPPISLRGSSESLFQNFIAYEECNHLLGHQLTSYAILLDCLINTSADAKPLRDKGIIVDSLTTKDIAIICNRLYNETLASHFYFGQLTKHLNKYCRSPRPRWRHYFMTKQYMKTWSIFSPFFATFILLLTFTQTLFSILSYFPAAPK